MSKLNDSTPGQNNSSVEEYVLKDGESLAGRIGTQFFANSRLGLMQLYDQIQNPLDDSKVINKLIELYSKKERGFGGFYKKLTTTVTKEYTSGQYYTEDADNFYSRMFNKWKNSILSLTKEQFINLYKRGSYSKDFVKMREFLKTVPDVKTWQEAQNIFDGKYDDKELQEAFQKYRWTSFGESSGWVHVCSRYVTAKQDIMPPIEHRLYLDTESPDTYKMINLLVEKFDKYHLPYYFKFDKFANRDDTIVIYSSTENLTKYVALLREIKDEHPDLISRFKDPPLLTGKIDGWIGYGSEPNTTPTGEKQSFNSIRAKVIETAIQKQTKEWIMNHGNIQITYKGQNFVFQDYIAMKSTEIMIEDLERRFNSYEDNAKRVARSHGTVYNQNDLIAKLGYTLQDIKSPAFKEGVYKILRNRMGTVLPSVCNGTDKDMKDIEMNVRYGQKIEFRGYDLEETIRDLSARIAKFDPNFAKSVRSAIVSNAGEYGIDIDKFCFDINAKEKMNIVG